MPQVVKVGVRCGELFREQRHGEQRRKYGEQAKDECAPQLKSRPLLDRGQIKHGTRLQVLSRTCHGQITTLGAARVVEQRRSVCWAKLHLGTRVAWSCGRVRCECKISRRQPGLQRGSALDSNRTRAARGGSSAFEHSHQHNIPVTAPDKAESLLTQLVQYWHEAATQITPSHRLTEPTPTTPQSNASSNHPRHLPKPVKRRREDCCISLSCPEP